MRGRLWLRPLTYIGICELTTAESMTSIAYEPRRHTGGPPPKARYYGTNSMAGRLLSVVRCAWTEPDGRAILPGESQSFVIEAESGGTTDHPQPRGELALKSGPDTFGAGSAGLRAKVGSGSAPQIGVRSGRIVRHKPDIGGWSGTIIEMHPGARPNGLDQTAGGSESRLPFSACL